MSRAGQSGRGQRGGQQTAQRAGRTCRRSGRLLNCCVTPRMDAAILRDAMPGGGLGTAVADGRRRFTEKANARAPSPHFRSITAAAGRTSTPTPPHTMASVTPSIRQFSAYLRCVRQTSAANGMPRRLLSTSATAREEVQTQSPAAAPSPPPSDALTAAQETPEYMQKWGTLDPQTVENKKQERRLLRREHVQPVGSRRRRAVLRRSTMQKATEVPFEQLPYQCFQEARKILLADRQSKIKEIETQQMRIKNLIEQEPAVSGGPSAKEARLRSMRKHLSELVILADINDPVVKRKFEDGQGKLCSYFVGDTTDHHRRHEQAHLPISGRSEVAQVQASCAGAACHAVGSRPRHPSHTRHRSGH